MIINLVRYKYFDDRTIGRMYVDGVFFGHTLEDTVRPLGIKVKEHTAIPAGSYEVEVTRSARFKRDMPIVLNVPMFTGIRIHGGNRPEDTEGCIMVAENLLTEKGKNIIQGTLERDLTAKMKADGGKAFLRIENLYQVA